jgi:hypothetical protein
MPFLSSHRFVLAAALIGAGLLAAPAAHAFTMLDEGAKGQDQSFLYPGGVPTTGADQSQGFKQEDGMTTLKEGNTTLQFGHRPSFDQRYNTDNLFDPLGHPPGVR